MRILRRPEVLDEDGEVIAKPTAKRSGPTKREQAFAIADANPTLDKDAVKELLMTALSINKQNANIYYHKWANQGDE